MLEHTTVNMLAFFGGLGWPEVVIIAVLVLLLFGGKKFPELARGVAKGLKSFKSEMNDVKSQLKDAADDVQKSVEDDDKDTK